MGPNLIDKENLLSPLERETKPHVHIYLQVDKDALVSFKWEV